MRTFLLGLVLLVALVAAYDAFVIVRALIRGSDVAARSEPYSNDLPRGHPALLVVGDSTAVGTGAKAPEESIAGRIAADFTALHVDNAGVNGALTSAVSGQLRSAPLPRYDMVLVQVGGNDALRLTSARTLRVDVDAALTAASRLSAHVAVMSTGNLGLAPALPWPVDLLFAWRARVVRDVFSEAAQRHGARYVDLFIAPGAENPFREDPGRYHAVDGLHPSAAGYGLWYEKLRAQLPLAEWLDR